MLSDSATMFVVASEYLKTMSENPKVKEHLLDIKCNWKFIPARAPWFGAIWERLKGLLKQCQKMIVSQVLLSFEELTCILAELEGIISDIPLSYTPGNLNQLEILTPNHLILGRKFKSFPRDVVNWEEISADPPYGQKEFTGKRFLCVSRLCNNLRKRWEREYLTTLRETHRVGTMHCSWPRIGEVVLIHDGPRSKWKLGQVIELHMGLPTSSTRSHVTSLSPSSSDNSQYTLPSTGASGAVERRPNRKHREKEKAQLRHS
ncbi:uncharacterized protein [Macrobrachium rosenbergii]|uniref:uncharacterized protein n=1 Tax=Macrobrachium rosenbergii TaxID=79674 RepID=UPI0034D522D5